MALQKYIRIDSTDTIDDIACKFEKEFYKKATVFKIDKKIFLQSYDTIVAYIDEKDSSFHRLWDDWSSTTGRHIFTFCYAFHLKPICKKQWDKMKVEKVSGVYEKVLNFKTSNNLFLGYNKYI